MQNTFIQKNWGLISYQEACAKMNALRDLRLQDQVQDQILFLEHPAVITQGKREASDEMHLSAEVLASKGIELVETDRGGKLTYHGPGQLVVYFIVNLKKRHLSVTDFVYRVEEGILIVLQSYGIKAERREGFPGLWVNGQKIASLGFHIHRGVTTHGIALNVSNDLTPFDYFLPCGMDIQMTSMQKELPSEKFSIDFIGQKISQKLFLAWSQIL